MVPTYLISLARWADTHIELMHTLPQTPKHSLITVTHGWLYTQLTQPSNIVVVVVWHGGVVVVVAECGTCGGGVVWCDYVP